MAKGSYSLFLDKLGLLESNDNYVFVGAANELGRYQADEAMLIATGFVFADKSPGVNDYAGRFTGRMGVVSMTSFLADPKAQDTAVKEYLQLLWTELGNRSRYEGQVLDGHRVTVTGLLGGAYLVGAAAMKTFLDSGGLEIPAGSPLLSYLKQLGGFAAPFTVDHALDEKTAGGTGDDELRGFGGSDTLDGNGGDDLVVGGIGNDRMRGGIGIDRLEGGGGDDQADGGSGADSLVGGDGDDVMSGGLGADVLAGDAGRDRLDGGADEDYMLGGDGADILKGGDGGDVLLGDSGGDRLDGGAGRDFMNGGGGGDTYVLSGDEDSIVEVAGNSGGDDTAVTTAAGDYSFGNVETVRVSSTGAIEISVASRDIERLIFDGDDGGTIRYVLSAAPEETIVDVKFGAGADVFAIDDGGFELATGIYNGTVQSGFFWGFDFNGIGSEDRIDLTDLGIELLVMGTQTSTDDGQFLLAPGARIEIGALFFENSTDGWFYLDSTTGLFSPSFAGELNSGNFII